MSIGSLQSDYWANQWASSAASASANSSPWSTGSTAAPGVATPVQGSFDALQQGGPWSSQDDTGTTGASASSSNPLQNLAADIQAMLIQAQSTAATESQTATATTAAQPATAVSATSGGTAAVTPEQKLATDLQTLLSDLQPATTPATQTANASATDATGQTEHHHHHHHHGGGGNASAATDVASTSTTSGTTAATTGSTTSGDQTASQIFAADIAQALQAYGGVSPATTTSVLTM